MKIFVYGTLMRKMHNHAHMIGATFLVEDYVRGQLKVETSGIPFIVLNPRNEYVKGEVWEVDAKKLVQLDMLEWGYMRLITRTENHDLEVSIYAKSVHNVGLRIQPIREDLGDRIADVYCYRSFWNRQ